MKFLINITEDAIEDTLTAYNYYENIRLNLGEEFLEELTKKNMMNFRKIPSHSVIQIADVF